MIGLLTQENQKYSATIMSQCHFVHRQSRPSAAMLTANLALTDLGLSLGLRSDRLATNRLSHGTAF